MNGHGRRLLQNAAVATAVIAGWIVPVRADRKEPVPPELEGVGIEEHRNAALPLDVGFVDDQGKPVKLGDYFKQGRPVVLSLVYFKCPMLCTLIVDGMIKGLQEVDLKPGQDYEMVTVSFDHTEDHNMARMKKRNYLKEYNWPQAAKAWHLLTGTEASIKKLTNAVGFNYRWNEEQGAFAHASAIYIITPDGRISRYLYGIVYAPKTLKLSLVEASNGKIGSAVDQILLYCFHYDADSGAYAPVAMNIMQVGGGITVVVLAVVLGLAWRRDRRRKLKAARAAASLS